MGTDHTSQLAKEGTEAGAASEPKGLVPQAMLCSPGPATPWQLPDRSWTQRDVPAGLI